MITTDQKHHLSIAPILAALVFFFLLLLFGGLWVLANVSMRGTATLPNGAIVDISAGAGGFSVAENSGSTKIGIAGRDFEFDASTIVVDGVAVGAIDDSVKQISLTANRDGVTLIYGGKTIALPD